jgi:ABC-type siderophore export system fused ATPase/permease subunit
MDIGSLLGVVIVLAIIGVALYIIQIKVPMDSSIKLLIQVIVILFVVLWLLSLVGITPRFR